jgi:CO dehydrogenase/acetyl-CoA synthase epsilon subunit
MELYPKAIGWERGRLKSADEVGAEEAERIRKSVDRGVADAEAELSKLPALIRDATVRSVSARTTRDVLFLLGLGVEVVSKVWRGYGG